MLLEHHLRFGQKYGVDQAHAVNGPTISVRIRRAEWGGPVELKTNLAHALPVMAAWNKLHASYAHLLPSTFRWYGSSLQPDQSWPAK